VVGSTTSGAGTVIEVWVIGSGGTLSENPLLLEKVTHTSDDVSKPPPEIVICERGAADDGLTERIPIATMFSEAGADAPPPGDGLVTRIVSVPTAATSPDWS